MKEFEIFWTDVSDDGEQWAKSQVFKAVDENAACDAWEVEIEPYVDTTGIDDCVEVVKHPLAKQNMCIKMLDGNMYMIPVLFIARHRVNRGCLTLDEVLADFESDISRIPSYATQHIKWKDVQRVAFYVEKSYTQKEFQMCWENTVELGDKIEII